MSFDPVDRRELLGRAFALLGASALPSGAWAAAGEQPRYELEPTRLELLSAFADTIIPATDTPGALAAKVPERFDALLAAWATPERKAEIVGALDAIDVLAKARFQRGFAGLTPEERDSVLGPYDLAALKPGAPPATVVDPQVGRAKQEPVQPTSYAEKGRSRYADPAYARLKEFVVVLFYLSETALTHDLAYQHDPGAWEPSIPVTPATRPWGGIGAN